MVVVMYLSIKLMNSVLSPSGLNFGAPLIQKSAWICGQPGKKNRGLGLLSCDI
jgi:hypothetical protein